MPAVYAHLQHCLPWSEPAAVPLRTHQSRHLILLAHDPGRHHRLLPLLGLLHVRSHIALGGPGQREVGGVLQRPFLLAGRGQPPPAALGHTGAEGGAAGGAGASGVAPAGAARPLRCPQATSGHSLPRPAPDPLQTHASGHLPARVSVHCWNILPAHRVLPPGLDVL